MKGKVGTALCLLMLFGCSLKKATINAYTDPSYTKGEIGSIAVLPPRNFDVAPGEALQINRKISMAVKNKNPEISIVGPEESVRIINEHDLAGEWAYFFDAYVSSGVPDVNVLNEIGGALDVDAILQGEILNIFQEDGDYDSIRGTTRVTVRFTMLSISRGKMIWQAESDGFRQTVTSFESAPPIIEAINLAVDKIIATLPAL